MKLNKLSIISKFLLVQKIIEFDSSKKNSNSIVYLIEK